MGLASRNFFDVQIAVKVCEPPITSNELSHGVDVLVLQLHVLERRHAERRGDLRAAFEQGDGGVGRRHRHGERVELFEFLGAKELGRFDLQK